MGVRDLFSVRIVGAGSIGNHLANGFITQNFSVEVYDNDLQALRRMKNEIYPSRYGQWDERIKLIEDISLVKNDTDVLVIGTPPEFHLQAALEHLKINSPKLILIEKPISHPDLSLLTKLQGIISAKNCKILVGYNHRLTPNTQFATEILKAGKIGSIISITSQTRESWNGILKAHPWISDASESYLSSSSRGGGALYEHSHALNLLQYFIDICGLQPISSVQAGIEFVKLGTSKYDRISILTLFNKSGQIFSVVQDFVTNPPLKEILINGTDGQIIWRTSSNFDEVICYRLNGEIFDNFKIDKKRADDFSSEITHIKELLSQELQDSTLDYKFAVDTMNVIRAAFESNEQGVRINL